MLKFKARKQNGCTKSRKIAINFNEFLTLVQLVFFNRSAFQIVSGPYLSWQSYFISLMKTIDSKTLSVGIVGLKTFKDCDKSSIYRMCSLRYVFVCFSYSLDMLSLCLARGELSGCSGN